VDLTPTDIESWRSEGRGCGSDLRSRAAQGVILITTKSGHLARPALHAQLASRAIDIPLLPLQTRFGRSRGVARGV